MSIINYGVIVVRLRRSCEAIEKSSKKSYDGEPFEDDGLRATVAAS